MADIDKSLPNGARPEDEVAEEQRKKSNMKNGEEEGQREKGKEAADEPPCFVWASSG